MGSAWTVLLCFDGHGLANCSQTLRLVAPHCCSQHPTISFFADTGSSTVLTCAGNFTLRERACYSYPGQAVRRSFYHAERHCSRLQASLASLLSYDEESFVVQLVDKETPFWIGLTDQANDKNASAARFRWTDGADLTAHARWRAGELIGAGHLHCVQVDREGWALARGGCASTKLPFVCKKQGELGCMAQCRTELHSVCYSLSLHSSD